MLIEGLGLVCAHSYTKFVLSSDKGFLLSDNTNGSSASKTQNRHGFVEARKKSYETRTTDGFNVDFVLFIKEFPVLNT